MRLYHRTTRCAARAILAEGFRNAWGYYLTDRLWYGVWLSESATGADQGPGGDTLLVVDLDLPDSDLAGYRWDFGRGYRDFLLPADLINARAAIRAGDHPPEEP